MAQEKPVDFIHEIAPILRKHCASCHTNGTYKGSLSLDTREGIVKSKVAREGNSKGSDLIRRVHSSNPEERMPPKGDRLKEKEIALLARWIDQKFPWEPGFSFKATAYVPPLRFRQVAIPGGAGHPIDWILLKHYGTNQLAPPAGISDAAFYRRVSLDLVGLLPLPAELQAFSSNAYSNKRGRLILQLLEDKRAYSDHWLAFWNDLLRNEFKGTGFIDGGRKQITAWLYSSLLSNKPYDQFVRELLLPGADSEGFIKGIKWRGRVNASQVPEIQFSQNVSQVFFGINMKCASCHDSFIDTWKLQDAYSLAAIVADKPLEIYRCDKETGKFAEASFLWPELGKIDPKAPRQQRLEQLAALVTHPENGRFARTMANRYWHRLMGRGIVHPVDVMANQPWNEDLLDYLAEYFKKSGYDSKKLLEHIASSQAYQSRAVMLAEDPGTADVVFHGPLLKRLTAEQFIDAVWLITGAAPKKIDAPLGKEPPPAAGLIERQMVRATMVHSNLLMRTLGRPNREQVVTTRAETLTTLEALDLASGPIFHDLVLQGGNRLHKSQGSSNPRKIVEQIFLAALSRLPVESEVQSAVAILGDNPSPETLADFIWVIFLLPEFQLVG
ncbi:MAG: DUF1553 domain-containing protein [Gemmataceae bacterium]|nr:DUF1553 domain-containing protein [Gemmataceae bacterium]